MTVLIIGTVSYLRRAISHGSMFCCNTENVTIFQVSTKLLTYSQCHHMMDRPYIGSPMTVGYSDLPQPGGLSDYRTVWMHLHHPVL